MGSFGTFDRQNFADQLSIDTPEGVELRYSVAGLGSRCLAQLLDQLILVGFYVGVGLLLVMFFSAVPGTHLSTAGNWFVAAFVFANFLLIWGYFVLFEAFWHGQTPGKRALRLRVIKDGGRQITLFESMARNLIRVVDYMPGLYLTGVITMLCNKRNKRLGDLAAGTLVIHERGEDPGLLTSVGSGWRPEGSPAGLAGMPAMFPADAVARLGERDLVVIEAFFARALDLPPGTRREIAERILRQTVAKMGQAVPPGSPERVLEAIATQLRGSGRRW